jgi:hypothetical protein
MLLRRSVCPIIGYNYRISETPIFTISTTMSGSGVGVNKGVTSTRKEVDSRKDSKLGEWRNW